MRDVHPSCKLNIWNKEPFSVPRDYDVSAKLGGSHPIPDPGFFEAPNLVAFTVSYALNRDEEEEFNDKSCHEYFANIAKAPGPKHLRVHFPYAAENEPPPQEKLTQPPNKVQPEPGPVLESLDIWTEY
ncbi:hypothetical protein BDV19DRAFT_384672 [Aspergillus venezuelensis]